MKNGFDVLYYTVAMRRYEAIIFRYNASRHAILNSCMHIRNHTLEWGKGK
jgi:nitrite reductase/ring-hydroxylating ferredoxin subunit